MPRLILCGIVLGTIVMQSMIGHTDRHSVQPEQTHVPGTVLHHLALAVLALQHLKIGTLSLHLSVLVQVLIPFVVTSRPTIVSRPTKPLNLFLLAPQFRLLLSTVRVY